MLLIKAGIFALHQVDYLVSYIVTHSMNWFPSPVTVRKRFCPALAIACSQPLNMTHT
jgi:hypothetical protein